MLQFLLEKQERLTFLQSQILPLEEIKSQCKEIISYNNNIPFSQLLQSTHEIKIIPHYITDEEFLFLFHSKYTSNHNNCSSIFSLFTSPLKEDWKEIIALKGDAQFAIRTGFYQHEFEIFQSILMGFHGLTIYVTGLDKFQLQYLTEVARDYLFSLFFVVHDREELKLVLETDAPYIVFSTYQKKNFSIVSSILYNLSQFVPKSASLFALSSQDVLKDKKKLEELGYCGLIVS